MKCSHLYFLLFLVLVSPFSAAAGNGEPFHVSCDMIESMQLRVGAGRPAGFAEDDKVQQFFWGVVYFTPAAWAKYQDHLMEHGPQTLPIEAGGHKIGICSRNAKVAAPFFAFIGYSWEEVRGKLIDVCPEKAGAIPCLPPTQAEVVTPFELICDWVESLIIVRDYDLPALGSNLSRRVVACQIQLTQEGGDELDKHSARYWGSYFPVNGGDHELTMHDSTTCSIPPKIFFWDDTWESLRAKLVSICPLELPDTLSQRVFTIARQK